VDQRDLFGKQLVDPKLHNGMSLTSANLHDRPGTPGQAGDSAGEALGTILLAVFIDVFHGS
jgi:hypothetical protein